METPVVAIVGAGASYASGDYEQHERPPLTANIFDGASAQAAFKNHRLAQKASRIISRDMKADDALGLERALRSLRADGNPQHAQMAFDVPLYLQELLLGYSELLDGRAARYDALVDELLKLPAHVHFVSLNYDVLLDNCLAPHFPLESMDDYISGERGRRWKNWSLIKPHGSVNWYAGMPERFDPRSPEPDLQVPAGPIECRPSTSFELAPLLGVLPGSPEQGAKYYPVLALPEGAKDRLVLPSGHLEFFRDALRKADEIDLLVLGYSAIDTEVLGLIKASGTPVRRMTVVNRDPEQNIAVYKAIRQFGVEPIWTDTPDDSYASWIDGNGLRQWVKEFGGPYHSLVAPEDLRNRIDVREYERRRSMSSDRNFLNDPM